MFAAEVLEHPGAASEEHGHEVDPDLIHQPRLDELPPDVGAAFAVSVGVAWLDLTPGKGALLMSVATIEDFLKAYN